MLNSLRIPLGVLLSTVTRARRLLSVLAILLLIYALLGTLWVPRLIKQYAPDYVRNTLQHNLTLGEVRFNPFTFTLQLDHAQLAEANGRALGSIDHLLVNAQLSSLFTGSYRFKKIQLDAPSIALIVNADGRLNLDLRNPNAPPAQSEFPEVRIEELQLRQGRVHVEDFTRPQPFKADFAPIEFTLHEFRTAPRHDNAFHFAAQSSGGEQLDWQGEFTVQPLGSNGKLRLTALKARTLQSYLQDMLPLRLLDGELNLQAHYRLAMTDALQLQVNLPSITASHVQVAPRAAGDESPWITLPSLTLSNTQLSLPDRRIHIQEIKLDDAQFNAWLDTQYHLNLLDLLGSAESSTTPWSSRVDSVLVNNAGMRLEDRSVTPAATFTIQPARVQIKNFNTPGSSMILSAQLRINNAELQAEGVVQPDNLDSKIKLQLNDFPLTALQPYIDIGTDMTLQGGRVTLQGEAFYRGTATAKKPLAGFSGAVRIDDFSSIDNRDRQDFIKWQSLQLQNLRYSLAPDALEIAQVVARQPYGRIIIDSDGTNIQHVLRKPPAEADKKTTKSAAPVADSAPGMRIRIATTRIENGSANFTDNTVQPSFATTMQGLNGSITGLSSANNSRATIALAGNVDNHAPVNIQGTANFLAADTFSDLAMQFRNMELTTFNPYSGKFAGYSIAQGKLATDIRYQIVARQLNAQHHLVIDQLEFGAATNSKDAVPLPIKLAVALLKDRNGVIDLQLPVNGSLDDPQFKVAPIVWRVFVGLLTKIVTAPFAALGALLGGDSEQFAYVDFAPGSAALSATELDKLKQLARALQERPQLRLSIPLTVIDASDAAAMNAAAFDHALAERLPNADATPQQRLNALTTLYQQRHQVAPTFPDEMPELQKRSDYLQSILQAEFAIDTAARDALTRARAEIVQATLLNGAGVAPERIFLTARSNEAHAAGVVRMELKLE